VAVEEEKNGLEIRDGDETDVEVKDTFGTGEAIEEVAGAGPTDVDCDGDVKEVVDST